jgi:hypothetical protein
MVNKTGTYLLMVTDQQTGCFSTDDIVVSGSPSLEITGSAQVNLNCDESYQASAQVSGATG